MGLYDRNHINKEGELLYSQRDDSKIVSFVKETYKLFAGSMISGASGAYVGVGIAGVIASLKWPIFFLTIGLLIALHFVKRKPGINLLVLFSFTFLTGLSLGPLLSMFLGMSGGATIIGNAFAMTAITFASLSYFAINTKKDFTGYGKPLLIALLVVIGFSLVNMFFMQSPMMHILIQGAVVMLFSVMVIYDTQNIVRGFYETPIEGAVSLYLDFFNLFVAMLQIFGLFGGNDD